MRGAKCGCLFCDFFEKSEDFFGIRDFGRKTAFLTQIHTDYIAIKPRIDTNQHEVCLFFDGITRFTKIYLRARSCLRGKAKNRVH